MSKIIVTGVPGFVGSDVILRFLARGREVRTMPGHPTRAVEVCAMDTGDIQPSARLLFVPADRNHDPERVDAVAGCEFVDDRIRVLE